MKLYEAKHYLKTSGKSYVPGEVIDEELTDGQVKRLLKLNAIREVQTEPDPRWTHPSPAPAMDSAPAEKDDDSAAPEAEEDEDFPAPEIDVADGIAPPKASKTTKKGGKKK